MRKYLNTELFFSKLYCSYDTSFASHTCADGTVMSFWLRPASSCAEVNVYSSQFAAKNSGRTNVRRKKSAIKEL